MTFQLRKPAGSPAGGQFAVSARAESGTTLTPLDQDPQPEPAAHRPADRSPEHAQLAQLGVPAGKLSLLAPVEAKSVLGTLRPEQVTDRAAVRGQVDAYLHWRDLAETGPLHETRARRIADEATRQYAAARRGFTEAQQAAALGDGDRPRAVLLDEAYEAEADLRDAVRRYEDARADLRYLTDPSWRDATSEQVTMLDHFALDGARRRLAKKDYRGQVH